MCRPRIIVAEMPNASLSSWTMGHSIRPITRRAAGERDGNRIGYTSRGKTCHGLRSCWLVDR